MGTERDKSGRFARNQVPRQGHESAAGGVLTQHDTRRIIRNVANLPVILRDGRGRPRIVTMFEAAVWRIATGQVSRRTSPVRFVRLALESAHAWPLDDVHRSSMPVDESGGPEATATTFPAGGAVDFDTAFPSYSALLDRLIRSRRRT